MNKKFIIISFDAVDVNDFKVLKEFKNFKRLIENSSYSDKVESVYPSLTYPAHVSISTGKLPNKHGIINNIQIQPKRQSPDWFWQQKYIKSKTIYDAAFSKGLRTCAILWPVTGKSKTLNINVPEIFPNRPWQNQVMVSALNGSLLTQLKLNNMFGHLRKGIEQPYLDNFTFESFKYILKNDLADFFLIHLTDVDTQKHHFGTKSKEVQEALKRQDQKLGELFDILDSNKIFNDSTIIALGDHSFKDAHSVIKLNKFFLENGYQKTNSKNEITSWNVYSNFCDGSCYIYFNNKSYQFKNEVITKLEKFSKENNNCIKNIYSNEESKNFGGDNDCDFMLEAKDGYYFINSIEGPVIEKTLGKYDVATHGYFPKEDSYKTFFILSSPNIQKNNYIGSMHLTDEGATIFNLLDYKVDDLDGKSLLPKILIQ